jgi:integrase
MQKRYTPRRGDTPLDILAYAQRVAEATSLGTQPAPTTIAEPALCFDRAGRPITPQQTRAFHVGTVPANKGKTYKATPPSVAECMAMLNACPPDIFGRRRYAATVLLWQGALRAFEMLALRDSDLDPQSGSIIIGHGKGDKAATITMAAWAWPFLEEWRALRHELPDPDGPLVCVIDGPTAGQAWNTSALRGEIRRLARKAEVRRRCAPHQLRHAWAIQALQGQLPLRAIQLHLRHSNIGITDVYFQGLGVDISHSEVYKQQVPMVPATALLSVVPGAAAS